MQRNARFRPRFVAQGAAGGPPPTPAVLSVPIGLPLGDTTAYVGWTSDLAAGTVYWVVTTSSTPPSAAQVIAGQDHTGAAAAAAGNEAAVVGAADATATGLTSNTAYYAYRVQNNGANSNVLAGSGFTTLTTGTSDTSFDNLVAAMTTPPTTLRSGYIARMIQALYASGTWAKTDVMWVLAAHDEQAARLNWKDPGDFTLAAINSPIFTADRGYAGDGVSGYLDPNWVKSTDAVQFTLNDAHIFTYQRTEASTIGTIGQAGATRISAGGGVTLGERSGCAVNSFTVVSLAGGTMPQLTLGRRNDATNASLIRDGVEVVAPTAAVSTDTSAAVPVVFFRRNAGYTSAQSAGGGWGAYLDDTQAAAHYAAWHDYMVAVGADT